MCGKPGWIYDVDQDGNIRGKRRYEPPQDIHKFYASNVVNQIIDEYYKVLKV